jgi:tetratricopeptide (TPR) repeat protein
MEAFKIIVTENLKCKWYDEFESVDFDNVLRIFGDIDSKKKLSKNINDGVVLYLIGVKYYSRNKDLNNALKYWMKSSKVGCNIAKTQLGEYHLNTGYKDEAIKLFTETSMRSSEGFSNLAIVCENDMKYEDAINYYKKGYEMNDKMSGICALGLGKIYETVKGYNDYENAYKYYKEAFNREVVEASHGLTRVCKKLDKNEEFEYYLQFIGKTGKFEKYVKKEFMKN